MKAITFPAIDPVLISLGPVDIRWYALAYIVGILLAYWYGKSQISNIALWAEETPPVSKQQWSDFLVWGAIGIIVGGRLGYVLFYQPSLIWTDPLAIPNTTLGGMSFHGGLIGLCLAVWLFARRHKLALLSLLDMMAITAPIGLFFGRIANFINAELYGSPTQMPWGVIFPNAGDLPRHPSQLYEAALEGLMIFVVLRFLTHKRSLFKMPGLTAGLFGLLYGASRIFVEFFRLPDAHIGYLWGPLTMGMVLSLPMIAMGIALIYAARQRVKVSQGTQ